MDIDSISLQQSKNVFWSSKVMHKHNIKILSLLPPAMGQVYNTIGGNRGSLRAGKRLGCAGVY